MDVQEDGACGDSAARTVGAAAAVIITGMFLSRILGYVKLKTIAYYFGRTTGTGAFFAAFAVPDLLYMLVSGGALTTSFIPVFTEYLVAKKEKEAWRVANSINNLMLLVAASCVALGIVFAPGLLWLFLPGFRERPEAMQLSVVFARIIFPMVVFTSMAAMCNGILHSMNHFGSPAASWCFYNMGIILFAVLFHSEMGVSSLCYGVLAGAVSMVLVQAPFVAGKGFRFSPVIDLRHPGVNRVLRNFAPAVLGVSMTQINLFIFPNIFGSWLGADAVAALQFGVRLLMLPLGLFGSALSMAIFLTLSRQAGAGDAERFRGTLAKGISTTFLFSLPSTAFMIALALPITRFLFEGNEFTLADCRATAYGLTFFVVGLIGHAVVQMAARGFYAEQETNVPFRTGFFSVVLVSMPACYFLSRTTLGLGGIALGISLSAVVNAATLLYLLKRRIPELDFGGVAREFLKTAAATGGLLAAWWFLRGPLEGFHPGAQVAVHAAAGGSVFLALARVLRVEGLEEIVGGLRRKFCNL